MYTVLETEFVADPFGVDDYSKSHHTIHLKVSPCNLAEPLDLPLAPWA